MKSEVEQSEHFGPLLQAANNTKKEKCDIGGKGKVTVFSTIRTQNTPISHHRAGTILSMILETQDSD
jgi:hypothetical protein